MSDGTTIGYKMNFSDKCKVLGQLWFFHSKTEDPDWKPLMEYADLGLPMAYMADYDMVTIKAGSKHYINETWDVFCEMISIDPNGNYATLQEAFDASPNGLSDY